VKIKVKMVSRQEQENNCIPEESNLSPDNSSGEDKALLEEFWRLVANIARRLLTEGNRERDNCDVEGKENEQ